MGHTSRIYDAVPLQHGDSTNIRVITILGKANGYFKPLISCKFHTISLETPPPYTALSYTWGCNTAKKLIELDGKPFEVGENLFHFLRQARRSKSNRLHYIWVDAICIDQSMIKERNHQVGIMGDIYSKATNMVVWLGPDDPSLPLSDWFPDIHLAQDNTTVMIHLSTREYWSRMWILQEYVLAKEIHIWYGTRTIAEEVFRARLHDEDVAMLYLDSPVMRLLQCRHARQFSSSRMRLIELVDEFSGRMDCLDARDRIYAVLSLMDDNERQVFGIKPDYSKRPIELFEELVRMYRATGTPAGFRATMYDLGRAMRLDFDDIALQVDAAPLVSL